MERLETRGWLKRLPNKLSLTRIAAVPLLLGVYPLATTFDSKALKFVCALIFTIAAITDVLDGYLARRYGSVTPFGALLDQVADKVLVAAALVLLASAKAAPAFLAAILICRDLAVNGIRLLALEQNLRIEVNDFGKAKTATLCVAIGCLFVYHPLWNLPFYEVGMICLWAAVGLSLYSGWTYGRNYLQQAKNLA